MAKKVFVSFDYDRDRQYKNLLSAWDANQGFDFEFDDKSVTVPINSSSAAVIKAGITLKLVQAECLLAIVGRYTYVSEWVGWEIDKAKELGLGLIGVKVDQTFTSPTQLLGSEARWARSFNQPAIVEAVVAC